MRNTYSPILTLALALAVLPGCLSPRTVVVDSRYALQPKIDVAPVPAGEETLGIRPLQVAQPYGVQMAYLDAEFRFGYRHNAEWTEAPGDVVTRALTDALAASHRFADVGNAADMRIPSLILTGEIRKYHEDRTQSPPAAVCEIRLELRNARLPGLVWADTVSAAVPLGGGSDAPADVAAAMNTAVEQVVGAAVKGIAAATVPAPVTQP